MTDRVNALIVVLQEDLEDAEPLLQAIGQLRGVASAKPYVANADAFIAEERARIKLTQVLLGTIKNWPPRP
jgi:hypothetical protein